MSILLFRSSNILHQLKKNDKEKTAVAWFVSFHVAAVRAVVIQLNFQNDKLEFSVHSYIVLFHQASIFVLLCVDILYTSSTKHRHHLPAFLVFILFQK